jgi:uncharacterized protein (TIGR02099 family)
VTWRRRIHRTRLWLQALFASVVIVLAVVIGVTQIALPWIASHPEKISTFLSERLKRPVHIERAEGHWEGGGPLLTLHDVRIAGATPEQPPASVIPVAELKINFFSALRRNQAWNEFRLVGLDLHVSRDEAGNWQLRGFGGPDANKNSDNSLLLGLGALVLRDLHLTLDDPAAHRHLALGADEVRLLNSGDDHSVVARVRSLDAPASPVDAVIHYNTAERNGEAYIGGKQLDLTALLHGYALAGLELAHGAGRVQIWSTWQHDKLEQARIEADLQGLVLTTPAPIELDDKRQIVPRTAFDHLAFGLRWQRGDNGWQMDVADLEVTRQGSAGLPAAVHLEKSQSDAQVQAAYALRIDDLDVALPATIAMFSDTLPPGARRWLYLADPVGTLHSATLRYAGAEDFDVAAAFKGLTWHAVDKLPGVISISGNLLGDQTAFNLTLPPRAAFGVDEPKVFRQPLEFSEFSGDVAAYRGERGWRLETDAIAFEGAGYGGQLRGAVDLHDDGSRPALDVYAAVTHGEVPASHLFWPINIMSPPAVTWLDRALDAGMVKTGRAAFRGDLADWPFRNFAGRFEARAEVDDVRLKFLPDWPAAEHAHAQATFVNVGLHVNADSGSIQGNKLNTATADIADLGEAQLELDASAAGTGKDLLGFVKASPLGQRFGAQLLGVDTTGQGKVDLHLSVPIKQAEQFKLSGTVNLSNADLSDAKYGLRLDKANGKVRFTKDGFSADDLAALFQGQPASFTLTVGAFTGNPKHVVEANLGVNLPARSVLAYAPTLAPYADRVTGSADWNGAFSADGGDTGAQRLTLTSNLRGVAVTLPEPLSKAAETEVPLSVTIGMPLLGGSLDLALGDFLRVRGRLPTLKDPLAARVDFGGASNAALPARGFAIAGTVPQLDLSGWLDFATGSGGDNGMLAGIDLHTPSLRAYERDFGTGQFTLVPSKDGLDIGFHGAAIDGSLQVPSQDLHKRGITARFTKLHWPESKETDWSDSSGQNPGALPPLHIQVDDFRLGQATFGATTLESYPITGGTHFEQVSTHSDNVEMRAHGDWTGNATSDHSAFSIDFSAQNLGRMMDAFGYAGAVDGGATVAHVEGSWAGSPSMFALARLNGTLKVSVREGRIPDVDPGAGRIFGLFNLGALPRRLALDFGDFFKSGFSFDSIEGLFTLKDSNAFTKDLQVKGPAADIKVNGRTGLKVKDYDQIMEVTPHVGSTFVVGGALVGGPVGAAAGAVLQGLFRGAINNVTRVRYSVTGSWEKPTITQISKETKLVKPVKDGQQPPAPANAPQGL